MLREIRCEKFRTGVVRFHPGLNVVLGDDNATNSIGKSTLLMLVDFTFGGETLLEWNKDVVTELGHHHYDFAFEFDGELHRFRRATITPETVYVCDADYKVLSAKQLDEFTAFLKQAYGLAQPGQTFRAAVGLHLRVWGKANLIPDEPLHASPKQKQGLHRQPGQDVWQVRGNSSARRRSANGRIRAESHQGCGKQAAHSESHQDWIRTGTSTNRGS